jgi:glycosyltransferase involved in cell wall biosynthesis/UDP:flavonoid glycosyltransferase YjiC (YdhE family)
MSYLPTSKGLVTVILPTKNRLQLLWRAIDSVIAQTYPWIEIIVVNDGGVSAESVVREFGSTRAIRYLAYAQSCGPGAARNLGIRISKGEFIAYLDDDDVFYPQHVEILVGHLSSNPDQGAVYSLAKIANPAALDRDVPFRQAFDRDALLVENYIPNLCLLHRTECFLQAGYFDEDLPVLEDWDLFIRLSAVTRFGYVPTVTAEFVFSNERNRNSANILETTRSLYEKYFFLAEEPDVVAEKQRAKLAQLLKISQVSRTEKDYPQKAARRSRMFRENPGVMYAWELGNSFGHIGAFLPVARKLRDRRVAVAWAVADADIAARTIAEEGFTYCQSPVVADRFQGSAPVSFSDLLLHFGYSNPAVLYGLTTAWRDILAHTGAKLLLADHAPTAILAARTLDIPVMLFSYGFCVPPPVTPLPCFRPWSPVEQSKLVALEQSALHSINFVLKKFGRTSLGSVTELYNVQEPTLLTFPELDHFGPQRKDARYWGSIYSSFSTQKVNWPAGDGPRLFAYLRQATPYAEAVLSVLSSSSFRSVVVCPDAPDNWLTMFNRGTLNTTRLFLDSDTFIHGTDVAITYGSHGLTASFLRAGKPVLVLPAQLEQYLLAKRVEALGAGGMVSLKDSANNVEDLIHGLVQDRSYSAAAKAFAQSNGGLDQDAVIEKIVNRVSQLIG